MKQTDTMELVMTAQKTEHHLFRKPDQMFHGNTTTKKLIRPTKLWDILQNRPWLFKIIDTMNDQKKKKMGKRTVLDV